MKIKRLVRNAGQVGVLLAMGKLFAFLRDALLASYFGGSASTDAYLVARWIPVTAPLLVWGGLNAAAVPRLIRHFIKGEQELAWQWFNQLITFWLVGAGLLSLVGCVLARPLVTCLAPGFGPEQTPLAVRLTRWGLFAFPFAGLGVLLNASFHAQNRFTLSALSWGMPNLMAVMCLLLFARRMGVASLMGGLLLGECLRAGIQLPALWRSGWRYRKSPSIPLFVKGEAASVALDERVKHVLPLGARRNVFPLWQRGLGGLVCRAVKTLMINGKRDKQEVSSFWRIAGYASGTVLLAQASVLVDRALASMLASGSIAALGFALRAFSVAHELFAFSVATVLLPTFSQQAILGKRTQLRNTTRSGLWLVFLVALPMVVLLWIAARPVTETFFHRGQFRIKDLERTVSVLRPMALQIPGAMLVTLLFQSCYARGDARLPFLTTLGSTGVGIALKLWLVRQRGVQGLALASAIATSFQALLLFVLIRRNSAKEEKNQSGNEETSALIH